MDVCIWRLPNFSLSSPLRRQAEVKTTISRFILQKLARSARWSARTFEGKWSETVFFIIIFYIILLSFFIFVPSTFSGTQVRTVRTGSYAPGDNVRARSKALALACRFACRSWVTSQDIPQMERDRGLKISSKLWCACLEKLSHDLEVVMK